MRRKHLTLMHSKHLTLFSVGTLLAFVLATPRLRAATYSPAATAKIDWTPNIASGVGVPGGIPARTTIYTTLTTTGDSTDRAADIAAALAACPEGQTVLLGPGTFYFSGLTFTHAGVSGYPKIGNRTLRGSGSDPSTGTVLRLTGSNGLSFRGPEDYGSGLYGPVGGSPVKGATSLVISNTGPWELNETNIVGALIQLRTEDDDTLPVVNVNGYPNNKMQVVKVTAFNSGTGTITFQPALYQTPVKRTGGALAMTWKAFGGFAPVSGAGIEDLVIDNTYGTALGCLGGNGLHGSWIKNVRTRGALNYGMYFGESCQMEIRGCFIEGSRDASWTSSNHGGLGLSAVSASLIEDNVIEKHFPLIKLEGNAVAGNVFAYNFLYQHANIYVLGTHNSGNHCNLWEGNSASGIATDGYFGSAADDVIFRNDLHGLIKDSATPHYPLHLNRFTRRFEVVGNQLGRPGTTLNIETSHATAFNGTTNGVAHHYAGDPHVDLLLTGTLTTRISNSEGVITLPTVGQTENPDVSFFGLRWGPLLAYGRHLVGKVAVNAGALTITVSGGSGDVLPSVGTTIKMHPGPNGYKERDDAIAASMVLLGNYYYSQSGIPSGQALGSTTLPKSLFRGDTAPSFMTGYNWPPYDPLTRDTRFAAIPAGARYEASRSVNRMPTITPISADVR